MNSFGALETVEDYISDTRTLLQDTISPYRYDDPSLLTALNVTLLEGRRLRPDLFVYKHKSVPNYSSVSQDEVPIEQPFRLAFLYGAVGHALMRDQEDIEDTRASTFMEGFNSILIGTAASMIVPPPGRSAPPASQGRR